MSDRPKLQPPAAAGILAPEEEALMALFKAVGMLCDPEALDPAKMDGPRLRKEVERAFLRYVQRQGIVR